MATGELFTAGVEGIAAGGEGMLRRGGKRVFMDFCAPGEVVTGRITESRRDWDRAELLAVERPSPDRVTPPCPLFGRCGGCSFQHLSYGAQLRAKAAILQDAFTRIGGFRPPEPVPVPSPPLEYRNRMQFHCITQFHHSTRSHHTAGGPGLKARRSGEIVPLPDCPVADRGIREALRRGTLRPPPDRDRFTVYSRGDLLLWEGGPERGTIRLLDRDITLEAGCFFQSNAAALELLAADLLRTAEEADPALPAADLYCGVGTFAAFLARRFSRIDLMERDRRALALARQNVKDGRAECFALGDDRWAETGKPAGGYGFIVADPPRQGFSPAMGRWLAESDCPLLAYVSCDPATMARDSRLLRAGGYRLAELRLYDFYPQTAHIESLGIFRKDGRNERA
jgi:23S rRNA (uracil1939-C5)-methyltransferase